MAKKICILNETTTLIDVVDGAQVSGTPNAPVLTNANGLIDGSLIDLTALSLPWVDVRSTGAVADGVTDDTAAVQSALNTLVGGGTLYIPDNTKISTLTIPNTGGKWIRIQIDGTLLVTDTLPWPDYVCYEGSGAKATQIQFQTVGTGNIQQLTVGKDAIYGTGQNGHLLRNIRVIPANGGRGIFIDGSTQLSALYRLENVTCFAEGIGTYAAGTAGIPLQITGTFWTWLENCVFSTSSSADPSIYITGVQNNFGSYSGLLTWREGRMAGRGVLIDGFSASAISGNFEFRDITYEGCNNAFLTFDATNVQFRNVRVYNCELADPNVSVPSFMVVNNGSLADVTYDGPPQTPLFSGTGSIRRAYVRYHGADLYGSQTYDLGTVAGGLTDETFILDNSISAKLPSAELAKPFAGNVPFASLPLQDDATTWVGGGGTTVTLTTAPDGSLTAAALTNATGVAQISLFNGNLPLQNGDWLIVGAWMKNVNGVNGLLRAGGTQTGLVFNTGSPTTFYWDTGGAQRENGWYHACSGHKLLSGATGNDTIAVSAVVDIPNGPGHVASFWMPWAIRIPAGSITDAEATALVKSLQAIPAGIPAGGGIVALAKHQKLYFGGDTYLSRSDAGKLAINGVELGGGSSGLPLGYSPVATLNINDDATTYGTALNYDGQDATVTTGIIAPDGSTSASKLTVQGTNTQGSKVIADIHLPTGNGDWLIFGGWVNNVNRNNGLYRLGFNPAISAVGTTGGGYADAISTSNKVGEWETVVASIKLTGGTTGNDGFTLAAMAGGDSSSGSSADSASFWFPFFLRIAAGTMTDAQVADLAASLRITHANMPAGSGVQVLKHQKLYFGPDTYLSRSDTAKLAINGVEITNPLYIPVGYSPVATVNINDDSSTWSGLAGAATVTTGVTAPDGSATAATLATGTRQLFNNNLTVAAGDWVIWGVWVKNIGANNAFMRLADGNGGLTYVDGGPNFINLTTPSYKPGVWTPISSSRKIATTPGSSIGFAIDMGTNSGSASFWFPFFVHIPAGTMTDTEVSELMKTLRTTHANMPAGGGAVQVLKHQQLYFGNDTALQRDGAGIVAHRNGTQNQQVYLYNTYTDASNYERLQIGGATVGTNPFLRVQAAGTGVVRGLGIGFAAANDYFFTSGGLTLSTGHSLRFSSSVDATVSGSWDTALYRSAVGTLTLGNNTANDTSGSLVVRNHTLSASGTAISGTNFSSGTLTVQTSYWNGAAAAAGNWTLSSTAATGTNPVINFTIQQTSGTTGQLVVYNPLQLTQTAAATSGINQSGLILSLYARYWDGTQSQPDQWVIQNVQGAGTNPTSTLFLGHSAGTTGSTRVGMTKLGLTASESAGGTVNILMDGVNNAIRGGSGTVYGFGSAANGLGSNDTGISRGGATGTLCVGNGTAGDTSGKVLASNLTNVVAKLELSNQTAAIGSTTIYTPTATGTYRVTASSFVSTAGTGGTMDVQVAASNGTFAQTYAYSITSVGGGGTQSMSGASYRTNTWQMRVAAAQPITYSTIWSGVTGTPAYGLDIVVEQIQ